MGPEYACRDTTGADPTPATEVFLGERVLSDTLPRDQIPLNVDMDYLEDKRANAVLREVELECEAKIEGALGLRTSNIHPKREIAWEDEGGVQEIHAPVELEKMSARTEIGTFMMVSGIKDIHVLRKHHSNTAV